MKVIKNFISPILPCLIIITGFVLGKSFLSIISFFILCCTFLLQDNKKNILDLMFLMPFATIFKISPGSTSLFTILEFFCCFVFFTRSDFKLDKKFLFLFLLLFTYIISVDLIYLSYSIANYLRIFVGFILLYYFSKEYRECNNKIDFSKNIIVYFSLGTIFSSIIALFSKFIPSFSLFIRTVGYNAVITNRFSGLNGDPNYYTINLILALLGLFYLYSTKKINLIFWALFAILAYFGLQTYSKSFLLTFCLISFGLFFLLLKNRNKKGLCLYIIAFSICLSYVLNGKVSNLKFIIERFGKNADINSMTTGRFEIWNSYLNYIASNIKVLLFGSGIGADYHGTTGVHNWYIEMIYYFGIVGTFLYLSCYFYIFKKSMCKQKKHNIIDYLAIVILLFLYFFLQMIFSNEILFHIFIVIIYFNYFNNLKSNIKEH